MTESKVQGKPDGVSSGGNKPGVPGKQRRFFNGGGPPVPLKKKFEGAVEEHSGCIFDCQHNYQAKNFQQHLETLATYVGSKYNHGGDMRQCIMMLQPVLLTQQAEPPEAASRTDIKIWEIEITKFVKHKQKVGSNLKKLFSLVWGQCTELMKSKLQQMEGFDSINASQDSIGLIKAIKGLTFKFDTKQYAPMAMVNIDTRLYQFGQGKETSDATYYK